MGSTLRRRANLTWDIEGQNQTIYHHRHLPATPIFLSLPIFPSISKVCTYKKRVFGLFFLVLETVSAVLDGIGKTKLHFLLAAFVLSAIGFVFTLCAYIKRRARSASTTEVPAERQLKVVELVFSSIQLIASLIQFLLAHLKENKILDVKNNIDASVFPVAFAMIAVVFILQNDEGIASSTPEGFQQPIELDLISTLARNQVSQSSLSDMRSNSAFDDMVPDTLQVNFHDDFSSSIEGDMVISSPERSMPLVDSQALNSDIPSSSNTVIEHDDMFELSNENQVNPVSALRMRTNVTSKMTAATPQINQNDFSRNFFEEEDTINNNEEQEEYMNISKMLEVYMADTGFKNNIDLFKLNDYEDLYKKVRQIFNIDVEYYSKHDKWILIYEDDEGDLIYLGDNPWEEFVNHVKKIYIHKKDGISEISKKME